MVCVWIPSCFISKYNKSQSHIVFVMQDLERIAKTSYTSKNKESMVFEPSSEMDNIMVEDEIKKEKSGEV